MPVQQAIDTTVLVYAHDRRDVAKQRRARTLLTEHARSGSAALPAQVLAELGQRMLEIMRQLKKSHGHAFPPADLFATADLLWVRPGRRRLS